MTMDGSKAQTSLIAYNLHRNQSKIKGEIVRSGSIVTMKFAIWLPFKSDSLFADIPVLLKLNC